MGMDMASLVLDLKASLNDSVSAFKAADDGDFKRLLTLALPDMQVKRPITRLDFVPLVYGVDRYALDIADFAALKTPIWGDASRTPKPWEPTYPGRVPQATATWDGTAWWLVFDQPLTYLHMNAWGARFDFWYFAKHLVTVGGSTLNEADRGLLLLRAQVEAMRELMLRNMTKVVQMRDGLSGTPRNSTPAAMYELLHKQFMEAR